MIPDNGDARQTAAAAAAPEKDGAAKQTSAPPKRTPARPKLSRKRRRRQRARRVRRIATVVTAAMLALGIAALGLWMLFEQRPDLSLRNYPMEYEDLVRSYAAQNEIPPAYVAAVILAESSYQPEAVSSANAQGLMQLLPSTAEWIAGKFDETYAEGCLFDPETNIKYGCWYLGFLMRRYDGDKKCASAAYHAGQGTVDQWLKNSEYSADGRTLDVIVYSTTDTYVKRVLENYEQYEKLYAEAA